VAWAAVLAGEEEQAARLALEPAEPPATAAAVAGLAMVGAAVVAEAVVVGDLAALEEPQAPAAAT